MIGGRAGLLALAGAMLFVFLLPFLGVSAMVLAATGSSLFLILFSLRDRINIIFAIWAVVVLTVPPWISFQLLGFRIPVAAAISVAVFIVLVGKQRSRWTVADSLVLALVLSAVVASAIFGSPIHLATQVLFEWACCYAAGRMLAQANFVLLGSRLGGLLGWLAVMQATSRFNIAEIVPFSFLSEGSPWSGLQERGGQVRAELTLGHSIALGAVLTMLLPFALQRTRTLFDKLMVVGLLLGAIATFSRSAMLAALIVVIASLIVSDLDIVKKVSLSAICATAAWVVLGYFTEAVGSARNSVELTDSTAYREGLLGLIAQVRLIGLADGAVAAPNGVTYTWETYYSIDNGLLYLGLYLGLTSAVIFLLLLFLVLKRSLSFRQYPFTIVILSQVPFILTVAPITQYQNILWLILGAAVQSGSRSHFAKVKDSVKRKQVGGGGSADQSRSENPKGQHRLRQDRVTHA